MESQPFHYFETLSDHGFNGFPPEATPRALAIDLELFSLIEDHWDRPLPRAKLIRRFKQLLDGGASGDRYKAFMGHREVSSADEEAQEVVHLTPLEYAACLDQPVWISLFERAGFRIDKASVALWAISQECLAFLTRLHESGAIDLDGGLVTKAACSNYLSELLNWGANPNFRDKDGRTPLHHAFYGEQAQLLLAAGADPNCADEEGVTPFMVLTNSWPHRHLLPDLESTISWYVVFGLDLQGLMVWENELLSVGEWIDAHVGRYAAMQSARGRSSESRELLAARSLLKAAKQRPRRTAPTGRFVDDAHRTGVIRRESGVAALLDPIRETNAAAPSVRCECGRPLARAIDHEIFDLIERDATVFMAPALARDSLRHLLKMGATVDGCRRYSVWSKEVHPDEGESYYSQVEVHRCFTPLELAAFLHVPKWVGVWAEMDLGAITPAVAAAGTGSPPFVEAMRNGPSLDTSCRNAIFVCAMGAANLSLAQDMLDDGADVNGIWGGETALHAALRVAWKAGVAPLKFLLERGADPNIPDEMEGESPFVWLLKRVGLRGFGLGDETVAMFLAFGASPETSILEDDVSGYSGTELWPETNARECIMRLELPESQRLLRTLKAREASAARS